MSNLDNLELFLKNYVRTKKISWLELFIFEYYQLKGESKELLSSFQGNDKFQSLSFHMSYQLLKLLFSTICELMASNDTGDKKAVLSLRNFLTNGLGSRIITIMSSDLDLSNVTNERELVIVLTKIFPSEVWEADIAKSYLSSVSRADVKKLYKRLWLLDPTKKLDEGSEMKIVPAESENIVIADNIEEDVKSCEEFVSEEFNKRHETMQLSSSQLAQKVIDILKKLVEIENESVLGQTDQNSVTMCCLNFSLDSLNQLHDQEIFNEVDQTVIKLNLMELSFLCFNNLVNRDGKSIEPVFKKLFRLLELSDNDEISCGLIMNILAILNNLCVKKSVQKTENLNMFILCNHLILKRMKILSNDKELLHLIHLLLIRTVKNIRNSHLIRSCESKKFKRRRRTINEQINHHDSLSDACIFERLLIDSFPSIKNYSNLKTILNYFCAKGICCCNGDIQTIRIFMKPCTIPMQFLSFLEHKVIRLMFDKTRICGFCFEKLNSKCFKEEYFQLLRKELQRRQGWELQCLLHHFIAAQKIYSGDCLHKFIFDVIVPTFQAEKVKFLSDPEQFHESKVIVTTCLSLANESMKEPLIVAQFFNWAIITSIKDCSLIPEMAFNVCQLLKTASDNIKLLGANEDQRENIAKLINNILFSNVLFLTRELMEIYEQIDLPKNVSLTLSRESSDKALDKSAEEFEILDERTVAVKEALSDLDTLLLNTIYWNVLCDLITKDPAFQKEFVANIYNNFSGNILFTIAYNSLNSILLKKELNNFQLRVISPEPRMNCEELPVLFERCTFLSPVIVGYYDVDFASVIERFYHLSEINESFLVKLQRIKEHSLIYRPQRDKNIKFRSTVHKDVFLTDNVSDYSVRKQRVAEGEEDHFVFYQNWLNQIWIGIFEGKAIRDRFIRIVNRFVRTEEELKAIHRVNTINEITGQCGIKYLSSIARNCFDICWRLSDNISFTAKMSTALEELKLLLLQDNWNENKEAMVDALQLLLGVAEMKTKNISRMMFMDPENHLTCSNESLFSDFNSSPERLTFDERSDEDDSSDKKTETYYTADENYDGDEELNSSVDIDCSQSFRSSSVPTTFGYRNTNEHICKLVVEVLMDLSKRCVEKPDQWQPGVLISLVQRLSCMKSYLGGSEFLLKGFSTVLQSRNPNLIVLQKTILELIEDLNSPDSLKAFLSILSGNDAVVELLIARLETLCSNETSPRPFIKVSYPTFSSEATIASKCDSHLNRLIQSFRDVHLKSKLLTPFTESSQIIPLNYLDFQPWSNQGFTISLWIEVEAADGEDLSSHVISLGTEKLMIAFLVNSDGTFNINVSKPNQNLSGSSNRASKVYQESTESSNKENFNSTNIFGIALATLTTPEMPNIRTRGFLRNGRKKSGEEETSRRLQTSKVCVRSKRVKLKSDRWSHVCFSARSSDNEIMLLITLNGTEQELIEIPIDGMQEPDINGMLQLLCIGSQKLSVNESSRLKYSISTIMLFKSPLESPGQTSYLFSLGPDCDSLIECEAVPLKPLKNLVDFSRVTSKSVSQVVSTEFSSRLKQNVLVILSAAVTNAAVGYKNSEHGRPLEMFIIGDSPQPLAVPSLARSVQLCGGLSALLFLFARTIEMTEDPVTQSTALFIFLKMSYSNNQLFSEFEQKNLFNLVAHVFKHSNCHRGPGMLKAILDVIYGGTMFNRRSRSDDYQINERSELNIQNPKLLLTLLENFNIFQSQDQNETNILDLLFKSLMVVVRENHPFKVFNRQCLADHNFSQKLLEFCKIHLANSANSISITSTTALVIVKLLKMLSKDQPVMWMMNEIQKLLLLMHHPSESFVTHDRSKFHFTLPGNKPLKQSKLNLTSSQSSKYFNFSTKIRSTSSNATSPKSPNSPPRTPRTSYDSISLIPEHSTSRSSLKSAVVSTPNLKLKGRKFDELNESQTDSIRKALSDSKIRDEMKTPKKSQVRRLRHQPKRSPFKKMKKTSKSQEVEENSLTQEAEAMGENFIKALLSAESVISVLSEVDASRYEAGISVLQENLFMMIRDSVVLLDDFKAELDLPESLNIEMLIMFANHHEAHVRAAIIELIDVVTSREPPEVVSRYEKSNLWTHLGNQLTISRVSLRMAQACVDWICMEKVSLQDLSRSQKIEIKYKPAFSVLIAMLPSMVHDAYLLNCTTKFLRLVMESTPDCITSTMLNSLITSSIKALVKIDHSQVRVKESILLMLEQIATKSLTSTGSIQTLWELLYGLCFVERQKKHEVIREVHVTILKQLLSLCLVEQSRRGSRSGETIHQMLVVTQTLGNLPASEIKTRFHMIHDRTVQFVSSWENVDDLTANEVEFVKYLVDLNFAGVQGGSSLVLWCLNPIVTDEIKVFMIEKIANALISDANFSINDLKLLKSLLTQFLTSNSNALDERTFQAISKFCGTTATQQQQNWNWSLTAVEKIDMVRQSSQRDQNSSTEKIVYKLEPLVQTCIDSAMKLTRNVIDVQNKERRHLMNQLKKSQEIDFYREWFEMIQRMVHEDAPWHNPDLYPSTWELDETEGPGRTRIRLKRNVLQIEKRFFLDEFQHKASHQHHLPLLNFLMRPKEAEKYSIQDRIVFTFNGKHLTMELEFEGEIIITDHQLIFLANLDTYINSIICNVKDISEVWNRRYQHKEIALEIFLECRKTFFIIFETNYERDIVKKFVSDKLVRKGVTKPDEVVQKWIDNRLTNYEYLIELNKFAGRTYNDLMQYPVFPWILTNYDKDILDLKSPESFRKLNKTISTQYEEMEEHYVSNYKYLSQSMAEQPSIMKPYHYSSHYSNSGTILHFLVRLPPFTSMFLLYQDHNFDIPDRTFHSLATTFRLTSKESATDVKELIPEFFYLFDFFENSEGFNFGKRQSGELVNDVKLPPWCEGSARLFMLIHRQALECDIVRKQLNNWIDLIFGSKQKGSAAVSAINVFHPATYPEFQITNIIDTVERSAYETMIRTYGQMPKQIFTSAHKKSSSSTEVTLGTRSVLKAVKGLRWGVFTGSPQLAKPRKIDSVKYSSTITRLVNVEETNMFYGLPEKCHLMQAPKTEKHDLVLWSESDGIIRVKSLKDVEAETRKLFHIPSSDSVTACGSHVKYSNLWFGHESGNISVYVRLDDKVLTTRKQTHSRSFNDALEAIIGIKEISPVNGTDDNEAVVESRWNYPIVLVKHRGEVLDLKICVEFKIVVSIGIDGRTVIWDAQKIEYIRTIEASSNTLKSQLTLAAVSPTLGDILTVFSPRQTENAVEEEESFELSEDNRDDFINVSMAVTDKSQLRLHTINAKYIKHTFTDGFVTSACFSFVKEGTGVNVIAVGFNIGVVRMYSTWTLEMVREIVTGAGCAISEVLFTANQHLALVADKEIQVWESEGLNGEPPKFNRIVLN